MNKISFLLSILAISTAALGQIPKKNIKGHYHLPNCLNNPIDRETLKTIENKDFSNEPNNKSGSIWTVFSDKADNPVFTAPGQSVTGATLRFHQPLWVTNSAPDGWLQLKSKVTNQKIGWVKASDLIISPYPLKNNLNNSRKILILPSLNQNLNTDIESIDISKIKFGQVQSRPSTSANYALFPAQKLAIFFVLKQSNGFTLISKTDNIEKDENLIVGWVIDESVTKWDHRIGYGPSYGVEGEMHLTRRIPVCYDELQLEEYISNGYPANPQSNKIKGQFLQTTDENQPPDAPTDRMPEIRSTTPSSSNRLNVVTIANIYSPDELLEIDRLKEKLKAQIADLNILFILDATQSMGPYKTAITQAIEHIVDSGKDIAPHSQVKFGAIVYRDYEDQGLAYETVSMTSDASAFNKELQQVKCISNDNDLPEAQYHGIIKGLQEHDLHPAQSNLVILIGDAGNKSAPSGAYNKIESVVEQLQKINANFISFQTHNRPTYTYQRFRDDCLTITSSLAGTSFTYNVQESVGLEYYRLNYEDASNNTWGFFGATSFPLGNNTVTDPVILSEMVETSTKLFLQKTNQQIAGFETLDYSGEVSPGMAKWITNRTSGGSKTLEALKELGSFSFQAHTIRKIPEIDEHCLTPYVFMTSKELLERKDQLQRLVKKGTSDKNFFEELTSALVDLSAALTGEVSSDGSVSEKTSARIKTQTLGEVWLSVFRMRFKYPKLNQVPLGELKEHKDDEDLRGEIDELVAEINSFIDNKGFEHPSHRFRPPGTTNKFCYWIPMAEFPGSRPD